MTLPHILNITQEMNSYQKYSFRTDLSNILFANIKTATDDLTEVDIAICAYVGDSLQHLLDELEQKGFYSDAVKKQAGVKHLTDDFAQFLLKPYTNIDCNRIYDFYDALSVGGEELENCMYNNFVKPFMNILQNKQPCDLDFNEIF